VIVRHHQFVASAPAKSRRRWWGVTLMHSCISGREEAEGLPRRTFG
jgi:hypothetical protein